MSWRLLHGDARDQLATLPERSVQTCVTSPPYFGLRDYGHDGQIGLETTVDEYVTALVDVFRAVRRVLRDDGTVWLNLGDSYAGSWGNQGRKEERGTQRPINGDMLTQVHDGRHPSRGSNTGALPPGAPYKAKDLIGVPWMVAFALRADGWYLRSEIIWAKPNPMPESVTDRPTRAHEQVFMLAKQPRYFWDADAIREHAMQPEGEPRLTGQAKTGALVGVVGGHRNGVDGSTLGTNQGASARNKRSVWTVATTPFSGFDRRVRVPRDAEGDDIERTTSPSCPVHGGPAAQAPKARRDERAAVAPSRRSPDTFVDPAQGLLLDSAPTDQTPAPTTAPGTTGSPGLEPLGTANGHSTQSHKTGLAPATTPPCTPSAQTLGGTPGTSASPAPSVLHPGSDGRSSDVDDSADPLPSETADRTAHRPSQQESSACTCEFYRVERSDHFATFPPKLIEPCILAGSPERACGECGAPWTRVTERESDVARERGTNPSHHASLGQPQRGEIRVVSRTLGFEPSCDHNDPTGHATILDPFAGSGTTGVVALRHNRSFVGVELNAEYVELARRRICDDAPLFNTGLEHLEEAA